MERGTLRGAGRLRAVRRPGARHAAVRRGEQGARAARARAPDLYAGRGATRYVVSSAGYRPILDFEQVKVKRFMFGGCCKGAGGSPNIPLSNIY